MKLLKVFVSISCVVLLTACGKDNAVVQDPNAPIVLRPTVVETVVDESSEVEEESSEKESSKVLSDLVLDMPVVEKPSVEEPDVSISVSDERETISTQIRPVHVHNYTVKIVEPTCTTGGFTKQVCSCGSSEIIDKVKATNHKEKAITVQEMTCGIDGIQEVRCEDCNLLLRFQLIDHVDHNWSLTKQGKVCEDNAYNEYKCTRCNQTKKEALSGKHTWSDWNIVIKADCNTEGKQNRICSVCQKKEETTVEKTAHKWRNVETKTSTCSEAGYKKTQCTICSEVKIENLNKEDHAYAWKTIQEATCYSTGLKVNECTKCNHVLTQEALPKIEHTYEWIVDVEATCESEGHRYQKCTVCREKGEEETLPVVAHRFSEWVTYVQPSCWTVGQESRQCLGCGLVETNPLALTDHDWLEDGICNDCGVTNATDNQE